MSNKQIFDTTSRWVNIYQLNDVVNNIYTTIENITQNTAKIQWGDPVQNKVDLPLDKKVGYVALVISELKLYVYNGIEYVPVNADLEFATLEDINEMFYNK